MMCRWLSSYIQYNCCYIDMYYMAVIHGFCDLQVHVGFGDDRYVLSQVTEIKILCYVMLCYVMLCYVMLCYRRTVRNS